MRRIIELQEKAHELVDDIKDILHATSINMNALIVQSTTYDPNLKNQFVYLTQMLDHLQALVQQRPQIHLNFLITKQIQEEEEKVRRERLMEYQEKIYDQRRIISDKEAFFQTLLRPKKKKASQQTSEEFQQMKAKQKESDEKQKIEMLLKQINGLNQLKRLIEDKEKIHLLRKKNIDLEHTKTCSISNVNLTNNWSMVDHQEIVTQKIIPLQQKVESESYKHQIISKGKQNAHARTASLQHNFGKEPIFTKIISPESIQEKQDLRNLLFQIQGLKSQNDEIFKIYNQECLCLDFKRKENKKLKQQYETAQAKWKEELEKNKFVKQKNGQRYERCHKGVKVAKKSNSMERNSLY